MTSIILKSKPLEHHISSRMSPASSSDKITKAYFNEIEADALSKAIISCSTWHDPTASSEDSKVLMRHASSKCASPPKTYKLLQVLKNKTCIIEEVFS